MHVYPRQSLTHKYSSLKTGLQLFSNNRIAVGIAATVSILQAKVMALGKSNMTVTSKHVGNERTYLLLSPVSRAYTVRIRSGCNRSGFQSVSL